MFEDATPVDDTVIINVGDMLSRISNDRFKSTLHQVVAPYNVCKEDSSMFPSRYSTAYFCNVNFDLSVDCLPNTYDE